MCMPFLALYLSSFWSWAGITIGGTIILFGAMVVTVTMLKIVFDR